MTASLLPPNASPLERALEAATARLADVPPQVDTLWNPDTCPKDLLPWLAWGMSIDNWDSKWSEAVKRSAIADAIGAQRRKGTPASLRTVLDRIEPAIRVVEWFEDPERLAPYTFELELPLADVASRDFKEKDVARLLREVAAVKPVRAHMTAIFKLVAEARAWLVSSSRAAGFVRLPVAAVTDIDPVWALRLEDDLGEPITDDAGEFLEVA